MRRLRTLFSITLVLLLAYRSASAKEAAAEARDDAINAAVEVNAFRVVQLRYFGNGGGSLGAAAAPVTGYALDEGWVLTSTYALPDDPAGILCRFADGVQTQARLIARDTGRRLALLSVRDHIPSPVPNVVGRVARVGETTIALGRVYDIADVQRTVGVVSAVGRFGGRAIQTDALASPTNYGGPLIGLDGMLLGLLTPLSPPGQPGVSLYDAGVGFAIPPSQLGRSLPKLSAGSDVHPGWLGVSFVQENPLVAPATVWKVTPGSPAAEAELSQGDRLISLAREPTPTVWRFRRRLASFDAGQTVPVMVAGKQGNRRVVELIFVERPIDLSETDESELTTSGQPTKKPGEP
ncbi:MAG: trypsin-like peptidase domain-containing protein [Planctomycetota bacterium]